MGMIERFKKYTVALEEAYHDDDWSRFAIGDSRLEMRASIRSGGLAARQRVGWLFRAS